MIKRSLSSSQAKNPNNAGVSFFLSLSPLSPNSVCAGMPPDAESWTEIQTKDWVSGLHLSSLSTTNSTFVLSEERTWGGH